MKKIPLNIPNILSLYRIFAFPVILWMIYTRNENIFVWLLCINLITDILDGWIARTFHMETEIGARIDSIADMGTYICAFLGVFIFKYEAFEPHFVSLFAFIGFFIGANLLSIIKFGRSASLHLYSSKIGGYIQGLFFFTLFVFGFYTPFYYFMITWGIVSFLESVTIQLIIKEMKSNAKGLYWILKERSNE